MNIRDICSLLPGTVRYFKAGMPIIYQGEIPRCGFFVQEGVIKAYNLQANGEEQILRFYSKGDFLPLPWLYELIQGSFYYYEAFEPCKLIAVTRDDARTIINTNPEFKDYVFNKLLQDKAASSLRITALEQSRSTEKLLYTLYYLIYRFGNTEDGIHYVIDLKLTHVTLASLIGLTRETTTTEINRAKRKGILNFNRKIYTINKSQLEKAIGEDSFKELLSQKTVNNL